MTIKGLDCFSQSDKRLHVSARANYMDDNVERGGRNLSGFGSQARWDISHRLGEPLVALL